MQIVPLTLLCLPISLASLYSTLVHNVTVININTVWEVFMQLISLIIHLEASGKSFDDVDSVSI